MTGYGGSSRLMREEALLKNGNRGMLLCLEKDFLFVTESTCVYGLAQAPF